MCRFGDSPHARGVAIVQVIEDASHPEGTTVTSEAQRQVDLAALAPQAVLIDVSTVVATGPVVVPAADGLERILQGVGRWSGPLP